MKILIGIILIFAGIVFGLGMGIGWALIGGIIGLIHQIMIWPHASAGLIAFNIVRIIFSSAIGWVSGVLLIIPGAALVMKG